MTKTLILYSSREGQTKKISNYISDKLQNYSPNNIIDTKDITTLINNFDLADYDCLIIGASIHYGRFHPAVNLFIEKHLDQLSTKKTGFFIVNLTARKPDKNQISSNPYARKFLDKISWVPDVSGVFAGLLDYPSYKFFDKFMIRFIMKITGGETDTSKTIEYTDWKQVDSFIDKLTKLK